MLEKAPAQPATHLRQLAQRRGKLVFPSRKSSNGHNKLANGDRKFANAPSPHIFPARQPARHPGKLVFEKNKLTSRRNKSAQAGENASSVVNNL